VTPDGVVWCSESSGEAIARIDRDGKISHTRIPGSSNSPAGLVQGSDGLIWFSGLELIGRITTDGQVTGWRTGTGSSDIGLPDAIAAGPDEAVWYTNEKVPPAISRISPSGELLHHSLSITNPLVNLPGITTGPDKALWFTVSSTGENTKQFIGRMPSDGTNYRLWPLPDESLYPGRIVTGPDDALWFTTAHGIGRITVNGDITEHPMPDGSTPVDIAVGTDRALWFSTNRGSIGRVTTSGEITLHPLNETTRLIGIAAAPDGTLWVADGENDKLWHYTPNS